MLMFQSPGDAVVLEIWGDVMFLQKIGLAYKKKKLIPYDRKANAITG